MSIAVHELRTPLAGWWACPSCRFRRFYNTDQGALQGASKHMSVEHRARLWLPSARGGGAS